MNVLKVELRGLTDWLDVGERKGGDRESPRSLAWTTRRMEPC